MKKYVVIALATVIVVSGILWSMYFPAPRITTEHTTSLAVSSRNADSNKLLIKNSVFHPFTIINSMSGDDYDTKSIIILEESVVRYHPAVGWSTLSFTLTAWEHAYGEDIEHIWSVSDKGTTSADWSLDTDTGALTVESCDSTDGEGLRKVVYSAFTGEIITDARNPDSARTE